jgi:hypothetical protein
VSHPMAGGAPRRVKLAGHRWRGPRRQVGWGR